MQYNALMEEKEALEAQLNEYQEMKEELREMAAEGCTKEEIIRIAREKWGLFLPEEIIMIPE